MLRRVTGAAEVKMVGAEGVLTGGLDKVVNELEGEVFEVRLFSVAANACALGINTGSSSDLGTEVLGGGVRRACVVDVGPHHRYRPQVVDLTCLARYIMVSLWDVESRIYFYRT